MSYTILTKEEAEQNGFIIEGECCFMFPLGTKMVGVLGYNSIEKVWQFDTATNENGDTWQVIGTDLSHMIKACEEISCAITALCNLNPDLDIVGTLEVAVPQRHGLPPL